MPSVPTTQAGVAKLIDKLRIQELSTPQIAERLTKLGVPTPAQLRSPHPKWQPQQVQRILNANAKRDDGA